MMGRTRLNWVLAAVALLSFAPATHSSSQEQSNEEAKEAVAVPSEADPEAEGATPEDTEEAERRRQRRRMRLVTAADLSVDDKEISLLTGRQPVDSPDYDTVATLRAGDMLLLTQSQTIKLKTAADLKVGDTVLETENVAEDYPGVYGIWLKKVEDGWHFIFNEKPDVWGTMYDAEKDIAEVPVAYTTLDEPTERMVFELEETDDGGLMRIKWGKHQWSLPFAVVN